MTVILMTETSAESSRRKAAAPKESLVRLRIRILRFLQRHGKKLPDKNGRTKGDEIRTRNQFSLAEKHEVAKYIVENQNVLAKDVAMIFTEKFAKPLTADTVRRIKSEGTASAYMTLIKSHFMFGGPVPVGANKNWL